MKILAIHNFHRSGIPSGDDQVFRAETVMLESHGHEVVRYIAHNDNYYNAGTFGKLKAATGMLWSGKNYRAVKKIIRAERPDVVHVHTFFPLLSPSVLYAAKKSGVPVVATLHDTRFICPCATSLRGTTLCTECGDGHYMRMCRYKCFKGSGFRSFIVALIFKYHRLRKSFYKQIDRYICLNDNQIRLLKDIGFDGQKIVKKYNFVADAEAALTGTGGEGLPDRYAVLYGRLGEEKGIRFLMKTWDNLEIPLVVMGDGPLEKEFREWAGTKENVYYLGYTEHAKCMSIVKNAEFMVFPSICYEGCSMVEIEAMSLSKAIVATDLGFSVESIKEGYNGVKFPLGDNAAFAAKVLMLWDDPEKCFTMGQNARKEYEQKYMPEDNYRALMAVYETVTGRT